MRTTFLAATLAATALVPATALSSGAAPAAHHGATGQQHARSAPQAAPAGLAPCGSGQLCLWAKPDFKGASQAHELSTVDIESCVPLAGRLVRTGIGEPHRAARHHLSVGRVCRDR